MHRFMAFVPASATRVLTYLAYYAARKRYDRMSRGPRAPINFARSEVRVAGNPTSTWRMRFTGVYRQPFGGTGEEHKPSCSPVLGSCHGRVEFEAPRSEFLGAT
jgi:hypothetical protein